MFDQSLSLIDRTNEMLEVSLTSKKFEPVLVCIQQALRQLKNASLKNQTQHKQAIKLKNKQIGIMKDKNNDLRAKVQEQQSKSKKARNDIARRVGKGKFVEEFETEETKKTEMQVQRQENKKRDADEKVNECERQINKLRQELICSEKRTDQLHQLKSHFSQIIQALKEEPSEMSENYQRIKNQEQLDLEMAIEMSLVEICNMKTKIIQDESSFMGNFDELDEEDEEEDEDENEYLRYQSQSQDEPQPKAKQENIREMPPVILNQVCQKVESQIEQVDENIFVVDSAPEKQIIETPAVMAPSSETHEQTQKIETNGFWKTWLLELCLVNKV